jgi:tetratricopeptide (TPR) repeat protein
MWKGWASRRAGLWDQAVNSMQKAVTLNPRVVINLTETGQTLGYLGRFDEALAISEQAYEIEPDSFWAKTSLAYMLLKVHGETDRASTMVVGAQYTDEPNHLILYWTVQLLSGQLEEALASAQNWPAKWEVGPYYIELREALIAETLWAMSRYDEARETARKTLGRLDQFKQQGIDDYRVSAEAVIAHGILGDRQMIAEMVNHVRSTKPADAVEDFRFEFQFAQAYAYAGMKAESIEILESLLSGNSDISVPWLELDPAFNRMRDEPEFIALLERHR